MLTVNYGEMVTFFKKPFYFFIDKITQQIIVGISKCILMGKIVNVHSYFKEQTMTELTRLLSSGVVVDIESTFSLKSSENTTDSWHL